MKKVGIAVIGVGAWGYNHVKTLKTLNNVELLAICDINSKRVKNIANKFKIDAYIKSEKMLKRKDIEAVTIVTRPAQLPLESLKALRANKHILIEKPMAEKYSEAKKIVEVAKKKERIVTVGFLMRFIPAVTYAKRGIIRKEYGKIYCMMARRSQPIKDILGSDVIKILGIHDIDMARYLFDEEPTSVYANMNNIYAQFMLTFNKGRTAFIESNGTTLYKNRIMMMTGSKAIISIDYITQELKIESSKQTNQFALKDEPLKLELQHFANCVLYNKEPIVTAVDGLRNLRIAEMALLSAKYNRRIKL